MNIRRALAAMLILGCSILILGQNSCKALQPKPPSIDFGEVVVGQSSKPVSVTWKNTSNHSIDVIGIGGLMPAGPFSFTGIGVPPPPNTSVKPGASTTAVSIVFAPQTAGTFTDDAIPQSVTNPIDADSVVVKGVGIKPILPGGGYVRPVNPPMAGTPPWVMDFGDICVGQTSSRTLTLSNPNAKTRTLDIAFGGAGGGVFSAAATSTMTSPITNVNVPANDSTTVILQFKPSAPGTFADTVTFSDGAGTHAVIQLRGTAHACG